MCRSWPPGSPCRSTPLPLSSRNHRAISAPFLLALLTVHYLPRPSLQPCQPPESDFATLDLAINFRLDRRTDRTPTNDVRWYRHPWLLSLRRSAHLELSIRPACTTSATKRHLVTSRKAIFSPPPCSQVLARFRPILGKATEACPPTYAHSRARANHTLPSRRECNQRIVSSPTFPPPSSDSPSSAPWHLPGHPTTLRLPVGRGEGSTQPRLDDAIPSLFPDGSTGRSEPTISPHGEPSTLPVPPPTSSVRSSRRSTSNNPILARSPLTPSTRFPHRAAAWKSSPPSSPTAPFS